MRFFYSGIVPSNGDDGAVHVEYNDEDSEDIDADHTEWRHASTAVMCALSAQMRITSDELAVLDLLLEEFGNKPFCRRNAQAYPAFVLEKACKREKESATATFKLVSLAKVPVQTNIVVSHVLYKVKHKDDALLKLKARIAPHGNEDQLKYGIKSD